jgi:hypothetical protein
MAKKKNEEYEYNSANDFTLRNKHDDREDERAIIQEIREAQSRLCAGHVKCVHCGLVYGVCCEIEAQLTEESLNMIPRGTGTAAPAAGGGRGNQQVGLPYARWNSPFLTADWKTARIVDVKVNVPVPGRAQYSDVVAKCALEGQPFLLGMKVDSRELSILTEQFGTDENKWVDGEFQIRIEEDSFDGKRYVRVQPVPDSKSAKKGRG